MSESNQSERWHLVEATICDCTDGKHANEHWVAYVPLLHPNRMEIAARLFADHKRVLVLTEALENVCDLLQPSSSGYAYSARRIALAALEQGAAQ